MGEPEDSVQTFVDHAQGHEQVGGQLWASAGRWHLWWSLSAGKGFLGKQPGSYLGEHERAIERRPRPWQDFGFVAVVLGSGGLFMVQGRR